MSYSVETCKAKIKALKAKKEKSMNAVGTYNAVKEYLNVIEEKLSEINTNLQDVSDNLSHYITFGKGDSKSVTVDKMYEYILKFSNDINAIETAKKTIDKKIELQRNQTENIKFEIKVWKNHLSKAEIENRYL